MTIKRLQLLEFTDLPWWPKALRILLTDFLEQLLAITQPFSPMASLLTSMIKETGQARFVDLCSGSGGPWSSLGNVLRNSSGRDIEIVLTDKYPNDEASKKADTIPGASYYPHSVDACAVPSELEGIRTLFNGFHHFPPQSALAILNDAVARNQPIVVCEILQRSWLYLFYFMLTPVNLYVLTPWIKPRNFTRLLFTYVAPIAPIVALWDSVVSILRCYTAEEMLEMARRIGAEHYVWKAGRYHHRGLPVTYLVGYPRQTTAI